MSMKGGLKKFRVRRTRTGVKRNHDASRTGACFLRTIYFVHMFFKSTACSDRLMIMEKIKKGREQAHSP